MPHSELDPENTDAAYLFGRLFAEYEGLQRSAMGTEVNDRMYGKAMTNPALVFPALDRLAKTHLRKLRTEGRDGPAKAIDSRIVAIAAAAGNPPATLATVAQGRWLLGYYQQRAHNINLSIARRESGNGPAASGHEPARQAELRTQIDAIVAELESAS